MGIGSTKTQNTAANIRHSFLNNLLIPLRVLHILHLLCMYKKVCLNLFQHTFQFKHHASSRRSKIFQVRIFPGSNYRCHILDHRICGIAQ